MDMTATEQRVIDLAWDDWCSFDKIKALTGYSEKQVKNLMKQSLKQGSYRVWRARVQGRSFKHEAKLPLLNPSRQKKGFDTQDD
jgi:uncharacterized protein (TIGR03643 family)